MGVLFYSSFFTPLPLSLAEGLTRRSHQQTHPDSPDANTTRFQ